MNDRREELLYRKVNQLAAFVMAGCAILALLIGVVGILLQGQIKQARQDAAELELRLGQLERRLDQRAMAQVEPATPVKPPRRSRRRSPNTPPPATKPATEQRPSPVASGPVSPNWPILEKLKSLDPDDAQAGTVLDQLAADPQAVAQMDIDALAKAVRIKAALGDGPGTLEWGQRALLVDPNHIGVLLLMAEAALDLGRFAEAESLIARVAESSDPSGWAHLLRGRIALGVGKTKQARQALNQAKKSPGQAADAALLLAEMALAAGDLDAAQAELDYCEAVEADRPQALRLQAELFFERRQFDEFVDAVGRLIRTAGADHSLRVLLGRALIQLGRLGPAVAELQGVVDQDPENAAAWH
ncbi:MAG: tetratricopeptide repeat protein, partial [Phycisphaerae bacterium]